VAAAAVCHVAKARGGRGLAQPGADSLRHGAQDRTYYRVCCRGSAGEQVFDLFHDAVTLTWMLDLAHD
jgi:hypothetical protein